MQVMSQTGPPQKASSKHGPKRARVCGMSHRGDAGSPRFRSERALPIQIPLKGKQSNEWTRRIYREAKGPRSTGEIRGPDRLHKAAHGRTIKSRSVSRQLRGCSSVSGLAPSTSQSPTTSQGAFCTDRRARRVLLRLPQSWCCGRNHHSLQFPPIRSSDCTRLHGDVTSWRIQGAHARPPCRGTPQGWKLP